MFELVDSTPSNAVIKVIGVGGGGCNAIQHMASQNIEGVDFICVNSDAQALKSSVAETNLQIGLELTKGLGAGANPRIGRQAAEEDYERLREVLEGADMVFITAGMGGGTGTGAAPVIAEIAKSLGILTVAIVTKPFPFEGQKRLDGAEKGVNELMQSVDSVIIIPNEKLLTVYGQEISLLDAFKCANNVLLGAVQGISELITRPGLINVDFADVCAVMSGQGGSIAMMGTGEASGEQRALEAAEAAISSPLLEDINLTGARGALVNITAGPDMTVHQFEKVGEVISSFMSPEATCVVGTVIDPDMQDRMRVTVVVTGLMQSLQGQQPIEKVLHEQATQPLSDDDLPDYEQFDQPTVMRQKQVEKNVKPVVAEPVKQATVSVSEESTVSVQDQELDYLELPTFLRKK